MTATASNAAAPPVSVDFAGVEERGRAVDLSGAGALGRSPRAVAAAVRDGDDDRVHCPTPGPAHEFVGLVAPRPLDRRRALATVARTLGHRPPNRARIERLESRLSDIDPPSVDLRAARERVAAAGADIERWRERVATLRGRVRALRETSADAADAAAELEAAARALSEAETERTAARQALASDRERAREARDVRERRLRIEDRLANARREARAALAARVSEPADAAVISTPSARATTLADADPVTARLALARLAPLRAPLVLAARRFPDARAASDWLGTPVLRV
ncbi:MAG: hypothetical protein ABEJ05_02630 [Haloglomus sp.]